MVKTDLLDSLPVPFRAGVHDNDAVVGGANLTETLQTNLGSQVRNLLLLVSL